MTLTQQLITIAMIVLGTAITRYLPFLLPAAVFGLLVIYCLRNVSVLSAPYGIPELLSIALVVFLHLWKRQMLLSIAGGTIFYMILVQTLF